MRGESRDFRNGLLISLWSKAFVIWGGACYKFLTWPHALVPALLSMVCSFLFLLLFLWEQTHPYIKTTGTQLEVRRGWRRSLIVPWNSIRSIRSCDKSRLVLEIHRGDALQIPLGAMYKKDATELVRLIRERVEGQKQVLGAEVYGAAQESNDGMP